jgi:hypothetical protein
MNKKINGTNLTAGLLAFIFILALGTAIGVQAADPPANINSMLQAAAGASGAGYNTNVDSNTGLATLAGYVVRMFISFLGVIFICYTIYGGFLWMTAGGKEEPIEKAKSIIRNGVIGLIIILCAASIFYLISYVLITQHDVNPI